jgi:hypothetical protein
MRSSSPKDVWRRAKDAVLQKEIVPSPTDGGSIRFRYRAIGNHRLEEGRE